MMSHSKKFDGFQITHGKQIIFVLGYFYLLLCLFPSFQKLLDKLNLHRVLNLETSPTFVQTTLLDQIICGGRQLKFEIVRDFKGKIGMNTTANKFFHISKLIGLDLLNLKFVHFKKIIKIQFLKYGKT